MTNEEKQEIINAVLSAIRTNSKTIPQLTPVSEMSDDDYIELSGGRRVSYAVFTAAINDALDGKVSYEAMASALENYTTLQAFADALAEYTKTDNLESALENMYAALDGYGLEHFGQSRVVYLEKMSTPSSGETLPDGSLFFNPTYSKIFQMGSDASGAVDPNSNTEYIDRSTMKHYRWDGTEMVEVYDGGNTGGVNVGYIEATKTTRITIGGTAEDATPAPTINVSNMDGGKQVVITAVSGSTIYYTTDGTTPTTLSPVYTSPLQITTVGTTTVQAVAQKSGKALSDVSAVNVTLTAISAPAISTQDTGSAVVITATRANALVCIKINNGEWQYADNSVSVTINKEGAQTVTVSARAIPNAAGYAPSDTVTQTITIGEVSNNVLSGTSSQPILKLIINETAYTNIVNTPAEEGYEWSIDFGDAVFSDPIAYDNSGGTNTIFYDGSVDHKAKIWGITHMPSSWSKIGPYAFSCNNCKILNFGESIKYIGAQACVGIKVNNLFVPDTVADAQNPTDVNIGNNAFRLTTSKSIYLGASNIGNTVFSNNTSVTDITFGPGVKRIGTYLFLSGNLSHLTSATFLGTTPPTFADQNLFGSAQGDGFKIIVPRGSLTAYKAKLTNWVDKIEEVQEQ